MRYFIKVAYKGSAYHGWQIQTNASSIQELLEQNLSVLTRQKTIVTGAGRTDTGVHAEMMMAHFDTSQELDDSLCYKLNEMLPDDVVVLEYKRVIDTAHARFDALQRTYEYRIFVGRNPFYTETSWQLKNVTLNINSLNEKAQKLMEFKDFSSFARTGTETKTNICELYLSEWQRKGDFLIYKVSANRFLRNMVRAMVGTLVDFEIKQKTIADLCSIIESKNRSLAGASAPAKGLFLTNITYPKSIFI